MPPPVSVAAEATVVRRRVAMEWEDLQRVSTITNLVGERRGEGDNEDLKGGEKWGKAGERGRSQGRRTISEERGRRRDEKERKQ